MSAVSFLHAFYDHSSEPVVLFVQALERQLGRLMHVLPVHVCPTHFGTNNHTCFVPKVSNNETDIIHRIYGCQLTTFLAFVLSFGDRSLKYVYTDENPSLESFVAFYIDSKRKHLFKNADAICSRLRSAVRLAMFNNQSDHIDVAENAMQDIIDLVQALGNQ